MHVENHYERGRIVRGLRTAFPKLTQVEPLGFLGAGYGSVAVETAGGIDFERAALGDPATDIMTQTYLGDEFMRDVLAGLRACGAPFEHVEERLGLLLVLRELMGLAYGIEVGDIDPDTSDKIRATMLEFGVL